MSGEHVFVLIGGIVIGLFLALISLFVVSKEENHGHKYSSGKKGKSSSDPTILEMKQEVQRLQKQIDEVNRKKGIKGPSTISSGYDYRTACEELDTSDYDLVNEWNNTNYFEDSQEAAKFQEKLNDIDKILESDDRREIEQVLEQLADLCFNNPEDVELLYRIGTAHARLTEGQDEDVIKSHVDKGIDALSTALRLHDKHAEVHKWYAILLGLRAQFQPLKQKAVDGYMVKKHCDLACALNPNDAVVYHILGRFDYEIASLGWFQKSIAGSIIGETLDSSYADALNNFMKADQLSERKHVNVKTKIENKKMIGNTLVAMDKQREAEKWFQQANRLESGAAQTTRSLSRK